MPTTIEQAVADASKWADIPGVVAVGQAEHEGKPVIRVLVTTDAARKQIPSTFSGYPVKVESSTPIGIQPR